MKKFLNLLMALVAMLFTSTASGQLFTAQIDSPTMFNRNACSQSFNQMAVTIKVTAIQNTKFRKFYVSTTNSSTCISKFQMPVWAMPVSSLPNVMETMFTVSAGQSVTLIFLFDLSGCTGDTFHIRIDSIYGTYDYGIGYTFRNPLNSGLISVYDCNPGFEYYNSGYSPSSAQFCAGSKNQHVLRMGIVNSSGESIKVDSIAVSYYGSIGANCIKNVKVLNSNFSNQYGSTINTIPGIFKGSNYAISSGSITAINLMVDIGGCAGSNFQLKVDSIFGTGISTGKKYICRNAGVVGSTMTIKNCVNTLNVALNPATSLSDTLLVGTQKQNVLTVSITCGPLEDMLLKNVNISVRGLSTASCLTNIVMKEKNNQIGNTGVSLPFNLTSNYLLKAGRTVIFNFNVDIIGCSGDSFELQLDSINAVGMLTNQTYNFTSSMIVGNTMVIK